MTTPCTFHLCPEMAGWTVSSRPYCRAHMLDAVLATGLGTVTAVRIRQAEIVERLPLTNEEQKAIETAILVLRDPEGRDDAEPPEIPPTTTSTLRKMLERARKPCDAR